MPRFSVGDKVLCKTGPDEWSPGAIVKLDYMEEGMESPAPYQVGLFEGPLIFVPVDSDALCKALKDVWWAKYFSGRELAEGDSALKLQKELAAGKDVNDVDFEGNTLLLTCIRSGLKDAVAVVIAANANLDEGSDVLDVRPLHAAVMEGDVETLKQLLAAKANPDMQDRDPNQTEDFKSKTFEEREWHRTPLHYAATRSLEACSTLLAAKADTSIIDGQYKTPLHLALEAGRLDTAEALLSGGAAVDVGNASMGMTTSSLMEAAYKGEMASLELLLRHGAAVNHQGKQGMTPLHLAARGKHKAIAARLLEAKADVTIRADNGKTAMELATANGEEEIAAMLGTGDAGASFGEGAWRKVLSSAQGLTDESKFFDALQQVNSAGDLLSAELGADSEQLQEDPVAYVKALDAEKPKEGLHQLLVLRGEIFLGLGARERATTDFEAAELLMPGKKAPGAATAREMAKKVSCSILTGFLGSGKTTLLNHILKEQHGKRIAVIENEFGEVGIDDALVDSGGQAEENIVEMSNGCICCTIRGDLVQGLRGIYQKAEKKGRPLDGVIIETTGLADPAPVAQTFFADDFVQQHYELDGIITLVDSKHLIQHLDEEKPEGVENEAVEQIAFADRIMLNKCDLTDEEGLKEVEKRIRAINTDAPMKRTTNSEVDVDFVLGIKAFSLDKILVKEGSFLEEEQDHQHDNRVTSVGVDVPGEVDNDKLQMWISKLLQEKGVDLFRSKGVLAVKGKSKKFVFQAIHMLFAGTYTVAWQPMEKRRSKMIFIGKNLDREELTNGFKACLVQR